MLPEGIGLRFPALDGYELGGVHFEPLGDSTPRIAVVVAAGGGIPARCYRHFAGFLAASGIPVLTFDYRGIDRSRPRSLRGFKATAEDWSEWDCGGAIAWMRARYPDAKLAGVAHSIGSLIIGGAPNVGECKHLVFIAAHTGYFGDYATRPAPSDGYPLAWSHADTYTSFWILSQREYSDWAKTFQRGWRCNGPHGRTPELRPEATDPDASRARAMLLALWRH